MRQSQGSAIQGVSDMNARPAFHGSDIEKICEYYHLNKNEIIRFGANVNPLGLSENVKADIAVHLDLLSSYPDGNTHPSVKPFQNTAVFPLNSSCPGTDPAN